MSKRAKTTIIMGELPSGDIVLIDSERIKYEDSSFWEVQADGTYRRIEWGEFVWHTAEDAAGKSYVDMIEEGGE